MAETAPTTETTATPLIKEFAASDPSSPTSPGRLIIRDSVYGSPPSKIDRFFDAMAADAQRFEPPLVISRNDPEIVCYAGRVTAKTFGLELSIPEGHVVPDDYVRIARPQPTFH